MSDAYPQVTALVARFVLERKIEAIPENVRREGIRSLVNIIGCALGGSRHDAVNKAWAALQPFSGGEQVTLIGRSQRADALTAAFMMSWVRAKHQLAPHGAGALLHTSIAPTAIDGLPDLQGDRPSAKPASVPQEDLRRMRRHGQAAAQVRKGARLATEAKQNCQRLVILWLRVSFRVRS